ncbi:Cell wall-associated polypeptide CWBP200 [Delftia tsuruhatensis]|uniref:RHS repeat-associated core domain-containing protein n=1 Tax=Delftia tsuruhatensis TaxID=180282 RepID=UPI001E73ECDC|nr:RHS repeat-associated core domain-containing protein [Delftia tsuruhatensis]CAB5711608.1 Cell wall-associated polypeptide CWBP200 [Delftia tsuruhatensis]CAC9686862.1 Cell wall-associated polypeptide CWBP200 [Delftia tsuruhatensis]
MTGLPAARQTDMTLHGGPITQGSLTVHIGSSGGVACSTCPAGVSVGNPVNPMLGAKVQSAEIDMALLGPLPFVLTREYSSYQTDAPAPVGLLGPGWWLPSEVSLLQTEGSLALNDSKGRTIRFEPLTPGQAAYSRSESLWIVRGGLERLDQHKGLAVARLNTSWMCLDENDRCNSRLFFVTNNLLGPWWIFGAAGDSPSLNDITGQRLSLLGMGDRFGRTQRLGRDAQGRINTVQDGSGRQYRLELEAVPGAVNEGANGWGVDSGIRLVAVYLARDPHWPEVPSAPLVRYAYSARGELMAVYGRDASLRRSFEYHPKLPGRMTTHAHTGRPPVGYVYDEHGKVMEQHRQGALSYRFDYAKDSTTVTDSLGRTSIYHFEGQAGLRRVTKLQHPDGSTTQSRYDASGRLVASIDALGRETCYELDIPTGNILGITLPDGRQTRWGYNMQGQVVRTTGPGRVNESLEYDPLGRLAASIDALGHVTRYRYAQPQSEMPSAIEDARGGQRHLTWNATGLLTSHTDCSGSVTRYHYDHWGQRIETRGEEGARSSSQYDGTGLLVTHTNALNQTTAYAYNAAGDTIRITGADGANAEFKRDMQGQLTEYQYGGGTTVLRQKFQYDQAGRLIVLTNENGAHTTFEYDAMDRLVKQVNFDGRTQGWCYNAAGEVTRSHDENLISNYGHDPVGRVVARQTFLQEFPEDVQHEQFDYGEDGRLRKAWHRTELGGSTIAVEFIRDSMGRSIEETQCITGADGNKSWSHTVKRAFNELGIESKTHYEGLNPIEWQTYGSGHLHGVVLDGRSVIEFERDKRHRETKRQFGPTQTESSYDTLSRLSCQHTHSPLISEVNAFKRQHHYDAAGQLTRIETAQGPHQYGYDEAGRLVSALQPGLAQQHFRFDSAGNRLFEERQAQTPQANWEETVRQHILDKDFNLLAWDSTQEDHGGEPRWMDNRVKDDGEFYYEYDGWGNLRRKYKTEGHEEHRYHYDSYHRLIRYTLESDTQVQGANYHYDPFGRRVAKQVQHADKDGNLTGGAETTFYGWDGDRLVLTEHNQRQIHTIYEPGSFVPLIRIEGSKAPPGRTLVQKLQESGNTIDGKTRAILEGLEQELRQDNLSPVSQQWMRQARLQPETLKAMLDEKPPGREQQIHLYHCDHLGTPLALIDPQGRIAWAARVGPWGNVIATYNPENLNQPIRLPGQHEDEESGLYYNRHRYYDPGLGAYISQDPTGLMGGMNTSVYAPDPLQWIDPLGLVRWSDAVNNGLGILGNAGGAIVGSALLAAPEPTLITKVAGSAVLSKSVYGFGASRYGFTRALSDDSSFDIPSDQSSLPRTLVCAVGCNNTGRGVADAIDLSLDLAVGKIPVSNKIKLPIKWGMDVDPPWKQPISSMFTQGQNTALDVLQGASALQSLINSGSSICRK